jgi:hypothetical protein
MDYRKYDLFVASYQTASLVILMSSIYYFCGRWRNTILFMNLFGSLQFYHLSLCTLRQGLSSVFTVLLLILVFQGEETFNAQNKTVFLGFNASLIILTILSINSHWTGIVMAMIIYAIRYFQKIRIYGSKRFIIAAVLAFAILPSLFSVIEGRLDVYLAESGTGYGEKIFLTSISDLALILMVLLNKFNKLSKPDISVTAICYVALIIISSLLILFKIITLMGFGVALRMILGLTTLQLICLPVLLNNLSISFRILIIGLISTPYLVFIFLTSPEKFIPVQSVLF